MGREGEHWDVSLRGQFNWVSETNQMLSVIKGGTNIQAASRGCGTAERPQRKVAGLQKGKELNVVDRGLNVDVRAGKGR